MKPVTFSDAPGWEFEAREVSAGVYRVAGRDCHGRSIEIHGTDVDELFERCRQDAKAMTMRDGRSE